MKNSLHHIQLHNFTSSNATHWETLSLSYQVFGQELHHAPLVLINHALTGNSHVGGDDGWWKTLVGAGKVIDTDKYTVLSFNIPGNGYDDFTVENPNTFNAKDIARLFLLGLEELKISSLFALIGGSVGGSIGWEMLALNPNLTQIFIPVATDYKTSDWLHSQCLVQKFLLETEEQPLEKARIHAMLCYRTPESLNLRFKGETDAVKQMRKSHDWLSYHGKSLSERFTLQAYRLMNHLLMTISVTEEQIKTIQAEIHLISVDSDLFYPAFEIKKTFEILDENQTNVSYHEIKSIHGHDAFLMEYEQLNAILKPIF